MSHVLVYSCNAFDRTHVCCSVCCSVRCSVCCSVCCCVQYVRDVLVSCNSFDVHTEWCARVLVYTNTNTDWCTRLHTQSDGHTEWYTSLCVYITLCVHTVCTHITVCVHHSVCLVLQLVYAQTNYSTRCDVVYTQSDVHHSVMYTKVYTQPSYSTRQRRRIHDSSQSTHGGDYTSIDWFWLPIFRTNLVRGPWNKEMKFENKGAVLVQIAPLFI